VGVTFAAVSMGLSEYIQQSTIERTLSTVSFKKERMDIKGFI
jgi:hypothetical protein